MTDTTRKLATIVALDVAGYSARTETDEARTTAEVAALRKVIEGIAAKHGGRVFNTAGDGFMLEFGSSLAAVEAAFELAGTCEPKVRVGVHLGDVVVQPNGDLLGHGVNVAARLMAKSEPGGALVSGAVRQSIRGPVAARLQSQGMLKLDKMAETIEAFAMASASTVPSKSVPAQQQRTTGASRIVVLPFRARANDDVEMVTAEGLTDDVTTLLTSVKVLSVTPRTSLRRTLEPSDNVIQIAKDLSCRYAVTGSVRRSGEKLRVSVELIDIHDNQQKWSQRFDRQAEDIFAIQDEIAKGVVVAVGGVISRSEGVRALREHPDSLQAWELVRRASSVGWDWRPETLQQGMLDARKALAFDPNYALSHGWLSHILAFRVAAGWSSDVEAERAEAVREADETVRLGFDNCDALWLVIAAYWAAGYPERSILLFERSIQRRPDIFATMPFTLGVAGVGYAQAGRVEEGLALIRRFESEHPNDEWGGVWTRVFVGYAELCRGNYARVADVLADPPSELDGMCRVIALMCLKRDDEAMAQYSSLKKANPAIALDHFIAYFKTFSADRRIGAEMSANLARMRDAL
ncbi:MAG: adenylate/guanylate cyclase domain-containing protein [Micropepsaceae bacterium]